MSAITTVHGRFGQVILETPVGSTALQGSDQVVISPLQSSQQHFAEQMMVSIPQSSMVERHHHRV
jgi:hypothetical protein